MQWTQSLEPSFHINKKKRFNRTNINLSDEKSFYEKYFVFTSHYNSDLLLEGFYVDFSTLPP